jgi:hypothetical protein
MQRVYGNGFNYSIDYNNRSFAIVKATWNAW